MKFPFICYAAVMFKKMALTVHFAKVLFYVTTLAMLAFMVIFNIKLFSVKNYSHPDNPFTTPKFSVEKIEEFRNELAKHSWPECDLSPSFGAESVNAMTVKASSCDIESFEIKMHNQSWLTSFLKRLNLPRSSCLTATNTTRCPTVKGRRILVNYAGNDCCALSQPKNCETGLKIGGFDACLAFTEKGIDAEFATRNCKIFEMAEGAGLWLWKPYILWRTLLALDDGDIVFYADSGSEFIDDIDNTLLDSQAKLNQDIVVFSVGLPEKIFTKEEAFNLMDCNSKECRDTWQRSGTFSIYRRSIKSLRFVSEWLTYAQDYRIITDDVKHNHSSNHRHDQSILSLLSKKWKLDLWPDPSQWGDRAEGDAQTEAIKSQDKFKFMQNKHFILHTRNKY